MDTAHRGDTISRQMAIDILDDFEADIELGKRDSYKVHREKLLLLPSAHRTEPGRWEIKTDTDEYGLKRPKLVCSKCGKEPAAWDLTELFEFCPNCGARMRGEQDDS